MTSIIIVVGAFLVVTGFMLGLRPIILAGHAARLAAMRPRSGGANKPKEG